jgi:hypothetical protein
MILDHNGVNVQIQKITGNVRPHRGFQIATKVSCLSIHDAQGGASWKRGPCQDCRGGQQMKVVQIVRAKDVHDLHTWRRH